MPRWVAPIGIAIGAACLVGVGALLLGANAEPTPTPPAVANSDQGRSQRLVQESIDAALAANRSAVVRRQALELAPLSQREELQLLVDRGLVPRQALEPAPPTIDENLRDLVNRRLIPRQALEEAPVGTPPLPSGRSTSTIRTQAGHRAAWTAPA